MAQLDRVDGLVGNAAVKYPCRMASTGVLVLTGLQTVDGVVGAQDDRVLVKDNASVANGIYAMDSGDWQRAQDADNSGAFTEGSLVKVNQGTQAGFWYVSNAGTITIDTTVITFTKASTVLAQIGAFWQAILVLTTTLASRQALLLDKHGADIPAAANLNLDNATGDLIDVTGNTGITAITLTEGVEKTVRFSGTPLLTNGASLILPASSNIQAAAGDYAVFRGYAAGVVRCVEYARLSQHGADVASAGTIDLTGASGDLVDVTGAVTITAITLAEGREATVRFTGALTLTNGASLVLPGGANIVTAAGDYAVFRGYAAGAVRCVLYQAIASAPIGTTNTLTHKGPLDLSASGAGQISFPATQNASSGANVLDDYEEGTWTPSLGGSATYNTQAGSYVKIGQFVSVQGNLNINAIGSGSTGTVSGLPFTVLATGSEPAGAVQFLQGSATAVTALSMGGNAGATTATVYDFTAAATASSNSAIFQNSARLTFSLAYRTTA